MKLEIGKQYILIKDLNYMTSGFLKKGDIVVYCDKHPSISEVGFFKNLNSGRRQLINFKLLVENTVNNRKLYRGEE